MSRIRSIGHWPFKDATGTRGPATRGDTFGTGGGCVISPGYTPSSTTDFPFAVPTKEEAMWWFWRPSRWTYSVETPYVTDSDEISTLPGGIDGERKLITAHDGLRWRLPDSAFGGAYGSRKSLGGGIYIEVAISTALPITADYAQVIFDSNTGLWMPRVTIYVEILDDGSVTGHDYTVGLTNDPEASAYYGGAVNLPVPIAEKSITLTGTYDSFGPAVISFAPTEYWSHGGMWDTATGVRL